MPPRLTGPAGRCVSLDLINGAETHWARQAAYAPCQLMLLSTLPIESSHRIGGGCARLAPARGISERYQSPSPAFRNGGTVRADDCD
jgi:hypothetical protein